MPNASDYRVYVEPLAASLGGGFVAYAPELEGCLADGDTPDQALSAIYDAISCWLEAAMEAGRAIPAPANPPRRIYA
ncbi:type II toxin-antitoxin system HicB family antitoxin [Novosphingobium sp.]|uniref:type II toxin-antitoxin system HicB family antitoxin n=1 Tax=Novosphingobium sp. TaxID=1874826 RepID=UPI0026126FA2|nr:type II toxin-antitoxin system HicB family antitoxin [Novosphingobium sp.]